MEMEEKKSAIDHGLKTKSAKDMMSVSFFYWLMIRVKHVRATCSASQAASQVCPRALKLKFQSYMSVPMILGLSDILETTETTEIDISSRSSYDADPPLPTILGKENEEIVTFHGKAFQFLPSSFSFQVRVISIPVPRNGVVRA